MTSTIIIYHGNCRDGFGAAYLLKKVFPDAELYGAAYQKEPPDVTGKRVFLVDFSYPYEVMERMASTALGGTLEIYDHHAGAQADIEKFWAAHGIERKFDNDHSGTGLILKEFFKIEPVKGRAVFEAIEDRDLWMFKLPRTREICAALQTVPLTVEAWEIFLNRQMEEIVLMGTALVAAQKMEVAQYKKRSHLLVIGDYEVFAVNAPASITSELTGELAVSQPYAASYAFVDADVVVVSLRSDPNGLDVSEVAKRYGGGGHKHAAGFKVDRKTFMTFFNVL